MKVQVLRGIPGSGKSHYANSIANRRVVSADFYFMRDGVYRYDPQQNTAAHGDCLRKYLDALAIINLHALPAVLLVDNTNASIAEIAPYMALAAMCGREAEIIEFACDPATGIARNVHGVSPETVQRIHDTMQANTPLMPRWWKRTVL